jgi:hypothetical protein
MRSDMLHRAETAKKGGDNSEESTIICSIDGGRLSMRTLVPSALALVLGAGIASAATVGDLSPGYFALSKIGKDRAAEAGSPRSPAISEYIAGGFHPGEMHSFAHGAPDKADAAAMPAIFAMPFDEQLSLFEHEASYRSTAASLASMQVGANPLGLDAMTVTSAGPFPQLFNTAAMAAMAVTSAISALFDFSPTEVVLLNAGGLEETPVALPLAPAKSVVMNAVKRAPSGRADSRMTFASMGFGGMFGGSGGGGSEGASEVRSVSVSNGVPAPAVANPAVPTLDDTVAPVPVPAGLPLLAVALGALAFLRSRRAA